MAYWEENRVMTCAKCGKVNYVLIACSGDSRANEWEEASCFNCKVGVCRAECWVIIAAASADKSGQQLRTIQGRE